MKLYISASRIRRGDVFKLFLEECVVLDAKPSSFGQTTIAFTNTNEDDPSVNALTVVNDFKLLLKK